MTLEVTSAFETRQEPLEKKGGGVGWEGVKRRALGLLGREGGEQMRFEHANASEKNNRYYNRNIYLCAVRESGEEGL